MTMIFEDVEEFGTTRNVEPNPYADVVGTLEAGSGKGKAFTVDGGTDKDDKGAYKNVNIRKARRLLTDAGDTHGVTVRAKFTPVDDGARTRVSFTTVAKIARKPKGTADATVTADAPADAPAAPVAPKPRATRTPKTAK